MIEADEIYLSVNKLPNLLNYGSPNDTAREHGDMTGIRNIFRSLQHELYDAKR